MRRPLVWRWLLPALALFTFVRISEAQLSEDAACRSPNPGDWPEPAKPLFMIVVDSSGSMAYTVSGALPTCEGFQSPGDNTRSDHARCAVNNTVQAFAGLAQFGLAQFATEDQNCGDTEGSLVEPEWDPATWYPGDPDPDEYTSPYAAEFRSRRSAKILVPLDPAPESSTLLTWVDDTGSNGEISANGSTPLGGVLRDMYRYFSSAWTSPDDGVTTYATPLTPTDRECREVNVILLTDGDEWCDPENGSQDPGLAIEAAAALYQGFNLDSDDPARPVRSIRTYVINFAGGTQASTDAIAAAGGTEASLFATNEAELSAGLADIIAGAIAPETCDNADNNCNGCTDEGYRVYCNRRSSDCCAWSDEATRAACLESFNASITTDEPQGDRTLLPCWDPTTDASDPETKWLCRDPGETCDDVDNNCEWDYNEDADDPNRTSEVDEGFVKCPLCPTTETCDLEDNDCDGEIDEAPLSCPACIPSTEVCDNFDNDCDGTTDEAHDAGGNNSGSLTLPCILPNAPDCEGTRTCTAGHYGDCVVSSSTEVCDRVDNDCDGLVDEDQTPEVCEPDVTGGRTIVYYDGTNYPDTVCRRGTQACGSTVCEGAVGPSTEVCDGVDNDCDGQVDVAWDGAELAMVGDVCGACDTGVVACVDGALTCEITGTAPVEVCDGADNDCDGLIDETPLGDAPAEAGCWATSAAGCASGQRGSFETAFGTSLEWCAPDGATPTGLGTLTAPCAVGSLQCVSGAWTCRQSRTPGTEVCDAVDNDCDGAVDEGASGQLTLPCSLTSAANCQGTRTCTSGSYGSCNVATSAEVCDSLDNDCDGLVNEEVEGTTCEPTIPTGRSDLVYNDGTNNTTSSCRRGTMPCGGTSCVGAVGPGTEVCDGVDNDCDGRVDQAWDDSTLVGEGVACGACGTGTTVCSAGQLICQTTGTLPTEICDGLDNDCDGLVDEAPLADAPSSTGCWSLPADACDSDDVCSFGSLQWCAPEGATCTDAGTLSSPCSAGSLQCIAGAWACQQDKAPATETCDGADNDCNGSIDDALGSPVGDACGDDEGACEVGIVSCDDGALSCTGQGPATETCNGIDDDCDGDIDNGIAIGGECMPAYDAGDYPGTRSGGACQEGHLECDSEGSGEVVCVGGIAPQPEVCDAVDNDCDGRVDEAGDAPDGVDGTADPADATRILGAACGSGDGVCLQGTLACVNGSVVCEGGVGSQIEECDCVDNDCDGSVDESDPAICSPGKTCVNLSGRCLCAAACTSGEFACASGSYSCETATVSGTETTGHFCIPPDACALCSVSTVHATDGGVECAPTGTDSDGNAVPTCVCKDQACHSPCFGITCDSGLKCVPTGSAAGTCREESCYYFGCESGSMCKDGSCVADPCADNPCEADEVCKPSSDGSEARCVPTCASVSCAETEVCVEGECEPTGCDENCGDAEVCLSDGQCGVSPCAESADSVDVACSDGSYCEPSTGSCIDDPCTGVHCPSGQECSSGECETATTNTGGGSNAGGAAGSDDQAGDAGTSGTEDTTSEPEPGVWGLATGGGGCACRVHSSSSGSFGLSGLLFAALVLRHRRRTAATAEKGGLV